MKDDFKKASRTRRIKGPAIERLGSGNHEYRIGEKQHTQIKGNDRTFLTKAEMAWRRRVDSWRYSKGSPH